MNPNIIPEVVLPVVAGLIGMFMHTISLVTNKSTLKQKQSLSMIGEYIGGNILTFIYSLLSYTVILLIWYYEGLEFLGMIKGQFTFSTVFVGFFSQTIFDKVAFNSKLSNQPPPQPPSDNVDSDGIDNSSSNQNQNQPGT